jgi:hypothetical protein
MRRRGVVTLARKPQRGSSNAYPERDGFTRLDVTSGSNNKLGALQLKSLSPLLIGPVCDCDGGPVVRFENLWQYRKVYSDLGHWNDKKRQPTVKWRTWQQAGIKRVKKGKGIRTPPELSKYKKEHGAKPVPVGSWWQGELLGYVASRKRLFVPLYAQLLRASPTFRALEKLVDDGTDVLLLDSDGPSIECFPNGVEVTTESFVAALEDESCIFGHGFVVAALLAQLDVDAICTSIEPLPIAAQAEPPQKRLAIRKHEK